MGNWRMVIEGQGMHHNGTKAVMKDGSVILDGVKSELIDSIDHWAPKQPHDADRMWREFVEALKAAGHVIHSIKFECLGQVEYK